MYLSVITDAWSHKIVGWHLSGDYSAQGPSKALRMALKENKNMEGLIHHSDRGVQYCSKEYVNILKHKKIKISMTENGDPYENALAERMNRTIKEEFGMDRKMKSKEQVKQLVEESIFLYNHKRPHLALQMKTPDHVYNKKIPAT